MRCMKGHELLDMESRGCFDFFWLESNTDMDSKGYGLIRDRVYAVSKDDTSGRSKMSAAINELNKDDNDVASIASVGFGLTALVIGVERGWITWEQGTERADRTLDTLIKHMEHFNGFFYHFIHMDTAKRAGNCEVSIIDTAIAICGAITAGEYFGGSIKQKADSLYWRVNWSWYRDNENNQFYMGYTPERGFSGWWDCYSEQLMAYILGAGSPAHPVPGDMFYSFTRHSRGDFIHSWFGSLFTHQFSHAWMDFRNKKDNLGTDWWTNSVKATLANRDFCISMSKQFKTFHENSWGLTPCEGPWGYQGKYGAAPSALLDNAHYTDGTVPPAGAAGSIVFTPDESIHALTYYYENHPELWGKYGFMDAYNLDLEHHWYADKVIGIDKGITLLMIENYRTGLIWDLFMKNTYVQQGMKKAGLQDSHVHYNIA